ncbi:MAG: peroxidase, partial [Actinomycetota bacterium]|nr:peroxidase [Actinomycetota bacterium]
MPASPLSSLLDGLAEWIDRRIGWSRLPVPIALLTLIGLRNRLREQNLYDTGRGALDQPDIAEHEGYLTARTLDGSFNDLDDPLMGSLGSRFGRNVPLRYTYTEPADALLDPNPRVVSRELLTRDVFQPATTLNLLAGAWIQFEVHDWFSHGKNEPEEPWHITLEDDDPWPDHPMTINRTRRDPSSDPNGPATFVTDDTHWWDGSQIYGRDVAFAQALRSGENGKLRIDEVGLPPADLEAHIDLTGVAGNFWVGLALLHSLFMREHNAICDHLHLRHPGLGDQQLYEKARLVNSALMAKIHTVDWTPAIIANPTTVLALRANWWGLEGEHLDKRLGRLTSNEVVRGIPGSPTDHHGVPYSLTEEFVAVYRMHPLIPDEFSFRSLENDKELSTYTLPDLGALRVRERLSELPMSDLFYSFGRMHPGAITLHNYPRFLQHFDRPDGSLIDLATIDILRTRERGVPRYNQFRRLFRLNPVSSFEEMTDNPEWAEQLKKIYGDIERVDLMVGMYAEPKPKGFGFSDTAFRVFILMASRRLESDRFFTRDYRPEIYTQDGLDWVESNSMRTVLLRHFPG